MHPPDVVPNLSEVRKFCRVNWALGLTKGGRKFNKIFWAAQILAQISAGPGKRCDSPDPSRMQVNLVQ